MPESIQIAHSAITAKLMGASRQLQLEVQAMLSYMVEGAEHSDMFKMGRWDGRSTFYNFNESTFPAGFVRLIQFKLEKAGHKVGIIKKPLPAPMGLPKPAIDEFGLDDPRYDYQPQTVDRLLRLGQMIAQVATGGGKSRIANLATARIKRPTLFLTTRGVLMHQMRKAFMKSLAYRGQHGEPELKKSIVGILGDGVWVTSNYIHVGMVQTLASRLAQGNLQEEIAKLVKQKVKLDRAGLVRVGQMKVAEQNKIRAETIELLKRFELVILEEAHEAGSKSYFEIMGFCTNAHYRLSLTATPFMRDDDEANMRLMACSGPVAMKISEKLLIDRGILAKPYFKTIVSQYVPDKVAILAWGEKEEKERISTMLGRGSSWQRAYRLGVVFNRWRNDRIVEEAQRGARLKLPVLVLVAQKAHGDLLEKEMRAKGIVAKFVYGEHNQTERDAALLALKQGKLQVLIGSTILDVGVDVPALGLVVLGGGGKAEVAMRQRIGRGLREKKGMPNVALIVDFWDEFNYHLKSHSFQRRSIIESTPGFVEQLLPMGVDFDLRGLKLAA